MPFHSFETFLIISGSFLLLNRVFMDYGYDPIFLQRYKNATPRLHEEHVDKTGCRKCSLHDNPTSTKRRFAQSGFLDKHRELNILTKMEKHNEHDYRPKGQTHPQL